MVNGSGIAQYSTVSMLNETANGSMVIYSYGGQGTSTPPTINGFMVQYLGIHWARILGIFTVLELQTFKRNSQELQILILL